MRHHSMRITLTILALALAAACDDGDDVSLGDDSDQVCGGPMDAVGDGQCDVGLGIKWNGSFCEGIAGCDCSGSDCDQLWSSYEDCQAACEQPCNSIDDPTPCPAGQYCQAPNFGCGQGYCALIPEECQPGGNPVCGCDGETYEDICAMWEAGVAPAEFNACTQ